jgi:hypothetical protein
LESRERETLRRQAGAWLADFSAHLAQHQPAGPQ